MSGSPTHSYILPQVQILKHDQDQGNLVDRSITNNDLCKQDQLDPHSVSQQTATSINSSTNDMEHIDQADLLDYMYKHVQFDEIPFTSDPLYDHHQIYTHETSYMPYGIYENIQATVAFDIQLEKESNTDSVEDLNTAYMHNVGRPITLGDRTCNDQVRKEVYDNEQNEIVRINIENTECKELNEIKQENDDEKACNREMSQEVPIIPVYTPIVDEHHGVMFANSSHSLHREHYEHIYEKRDENSQKDQYLLDDINDVKTFQYKEKIQEANVPMVEAAYFTTEKAQKVLFDGEMYAVINYQEGGHLTAIYKNELEIPTAIDNGANVNVLPKAFYDQHPQLHELPKMKANLQPIMTGNGTIPAYFWMDIPLEIQGIALQLRCIICDSTAGHGLLLSRLALDQLQALQHYDKNQILIKMNAIPIRATQGFNLAPNMKQSITAKLEVTDKTLERRPVQGNAIAWITTNREGFPFIPVVSSFHKNQTVIGFKNNSEC